MQPLGNEHLGFSGLGGSARPVRLLLSHYQLAMLQRLHET